MQQNIKGRSRGVLARLGVAATVAAVAITVSACGSDDSSSSAAQPATASSTTAAASGGDAFVQKTCAATTAAEQNVKWTGPGSAFDATKAKGKTVWWITYGTSDAGVTITKGGQEAAQKLGMKFKVFDGKFSVPEWNRGLDQAVANKAGAIVLLAIDTKLVGEGVAKAKAAGIPVVYSVSPSPIEHWGEEDAVVSFDFVDAGRILANAIICKNKGKVNGHIIQDTTYPNSKYVAQGAKPILDQCSDCKFSDESNIPLGEWAQKVSTDVKTAITKNPSLNTVWPYYDAGGAPAAQAIGEAGKTDSITLVSLNGNPQNNALVCKGQQTGTVGQPDLWVGYATMDQVGRMLAGAPEADEHIPNRYLTKNSLTCPAPDTQTDEQFGNVDYRAEYAKLWTGVQ